MINTADFKQVTILISPQSLFLADVPPSLPPEGLLFRSKVAGHALAWLNREGKIHDELIENLMNWRHSGFSVHAETRIARDDRDGQKALAEYILRNTYSEQKITYLEDTGKVLYRSPMTHGSNKKNFEIFTAKEFIAAITQHIPDKHFQMVGYYGWYSSRSRGERKKVGRSAGAFGSHSRGDGPGCVGV
jgi:hypothetical protein